MELDPNKLFILIGIPIALIGLFHLYKAYVIYLLKMRCTTEVRATLTNLRSKQGNVNNKNSKVFNATYKYEYQNELYKEKNEIWAAFPAKEKRLSEGENVTLFLNPNNCKEFTDPIALYSMREHVKTGILLTVIGFISILWVVIKPFLLNLFA